MNTPRSIFNQSSYKEQLNSPEWLERTANKIKSQPYCSFCRRSDLKLNTHHLFYDWDRKLWEYSDEDLVVLCEPCHIELHAQLKAFRKHVFKRLGPQSFKVLNGALAVAMTQYDPLTFVHALAEFVSNPSLVANHAKAWSKAA